MNEWHTDKWFTSNWNFAEEVRRGMHFKDGIKIHDVPLRDGEQQAGLVLTCDQKIALAEKMAELGIHRIEAGMPAVSAEDARAVSGIVKRGLPAEIFGFARCMVDDVKRAADCGVSGIVIEIPSNEQMIREAYGWSLEKAVELSVKATKAAQGAGLYTVFFPIDMTRANIDWVLKLIGRVAADGHMDALAVVDTMGGLAPHTVPYLIDTVKSRIDKPLEVHFHDDFGLGVANSIMGLAAGADVVHTTISACGERAGNAAYEHLALALLTMYGYDLGLDYSKIYSLSKLLRSFIDLPVRGNMGVIGDRVFDIESGIVAGWYQNVKNTNPLLVTPYLPELTGHPGTEVVLGKHSGGPSVDYWADRLHIKLDKEQKSDLLGQIKLAACKKGNTLDEQEVRLLFKQYQ